MPSSGGQSGGTPSLGSSDPAALVGLQIGDFEIIREIGRGGMGTVFRARQKSLDRIVALKVLSSGLGLTNTLVLRFQREAQAAAKLHHDNIVPIHAQGESNGLYYYAMELIHGENLHDLNNRARSAASAASGAALPGTGPPATADDPGATTPMPAALQAGPRIPGGAATSDPGWGQGAPSRPSQFDRIAKLFAEVADALDYAHQQGVIHRDVKPHNLILGVDERISIMDFGLARVLEQPGVTVSGELVGSPLYMSPEQIMGGGRKVDRRTDIYSFGATLYELMTLSPPYPGETREQVISRIITSDVVAPRMLNPQIPVDLETICLKALESDADHRYQTAGAMRDDLRRFATHDVIRARRAGIAARAGRFVRRNKVASVTAAALALALALTAVLMLQSHKSRTVKQDLATASQATERLEKEKAELDETVKAQEEEIAESQNNNDFLRAQLRGGGEVGRQFIEQSPEAATFLEKMLAAAQKADPLAHRMSCVFIDGQRAREAQRFEAGLGPGQGVAQAIYLQALASEDPIQAVTLANECLRLAPDHIGTRMLAAALACANQNYDRMAAHATDLVERQPDASDGYLLRGTAELLSEDLAASISDFDTAVELSEGNPWAFALRGVAHARSHNHALAMADFDSALAVSPDNVVALLERGRVHVDLEDFHAAIADADSVIELEGKNAEAYTFRGDCWGALGRYAEASADYTTALELDPASLVLGAKVALAVAKRNMQQPDAAEATDARVPEGTPDPEESPPPSEIPRGAGADRERTDWLERLLDNEDRDPPDRGEAGRQFSHPLPRLR